MVETSKGLGPSQYRTSEVSIMQLARVFDGKKFMWDGQRYDDRQAAESAAQKYRKDDFEVETVRGERTLVFILAESC